MHSSEGGHHSLAMTPSSADELRKGIAGRLDAGPSAPDHEHDERGREDTALAVAAQNGDSAAREELIRRLLPLVSAIARSYRAEGLESADVVQEGVLGLLRALERYDPGLGIPFGAYATWWIRQSLQELRSDFMRPLRLPPRALRQLSQLKTAHSRFYASERREPTMNELSERTGIARDQVDSLVLADAQPRLLSEPVEGTEGEVGVLGDLVEDPLSADVYERVLDSVAGEQIRGLLGRLSDRERTIVDARFGFGDRPPQRLDEIGEQLGVSAERVRQLEERALAKLRHS